MLSQKMIDAPGRPFRCPQSPITLGRLCPDIEPIPSVYLVRIEAAKGVKVAQAQEGRVMRFIGKMLLYCGGAYFSIQLIIWWAKP